MLPDKLAFEGLVQKTSPRDKRSVSLRGYKFQCLGHVRGTKLLESFELIDRSLSQSKQL